MSNYLNAGPDKYLTFSTGYGKMEKVLMDDRSHIMPIANSILKWKTNWKVEEKRIAILDGETYFDGESIRYENTHLKTSFDGQTSDLSIQVVEMAFNVKNRIEKKESNITIMKRG